MYVNKIKSCGIILLNTDNEILGCHGTGRNFNKGTYDIPKGEQGLCEKPIDTALRELQEETGLLCICGNPIDLGEYSYIKNKNLHLFLYKVEKLNIKLKELYCSSTFINKKNGKECPEINSYKWIKINELDWFYPSLCKLLKEVLNGKCNIS